MSFVLKRFTGEIKFADKTRLHGAFAQTMETVLYTLNGQTRATRRQFFTVKYLEKMFEYSISTLKLIPGNGIFENQNTIPVWDASSLAALTRCVMDCYLNFVYMVASPVSDDEFWFRLHLSGYIAEIKRVQMIEHKNPNSLNLPRCRQIAEQAKSRLSATPTFQGLSEKEKGKLLRAKDSIPIPGEDLARMGGVNLGYYRSLHKFLSCHSHFYGFALSQFLDFNPNDEDAQTLFGTCIDFISLFQSFFLRDMAGIYPETEAAWEEEVKIKVQYWNSYMSSGQGEGDPVQG